jgi:hypothetical protein
VDEHPRAGDLGQQRVAWDPAFEPDPVGDAPATRGPLQAGTVRALAVAPQHGLPVAQVAQRPNRQLPPFQGSSQLTNSRSAVRPPSGRTPFSSTAAALLALQRAESGG